MEMWGTLLLVSVNSRCYFGCLPQDTCFWNEWIWAPGISCLSPHHSPATMPECCKVFKLKDQVLVTSWQCWQRDSQPLPQGSQQVPSPKGCTLVEWGCSSTNPSQISSLDTATQLWRLRGFHGSVLAPIWFTNRDRARFSPKKRMQRELFVQAFWVMFL